MNSTIVGVDVYGYWYALCVIALDNEINRALVILYKIFVRDFAGLEYCQSGKDML